VIDNGFSVILGGKIEPILVHIPPNPLISLLNAPTSFAERETDPSQMGLS
jgi:hypothetical protein